MTITSNGVKKTYRAPEAAASYPRDTKLAGTVGVVGLTHALAERTKGNKRRQNPHPLSLL